VQSNTKAAAGCAKAAAGCAKATSSQDYISKL
jgi:hypothetical protein